MRQLGLVADCNGPGRNVWIKIYKRKSATLSFSIKFMLCDIFGFWNFMLKLKEKYLLLSRWFRIISTPFLLVSSMWKFCVLSAKLTTIIFLWLDIFSSHWTLLLIIFLSYRINKIFVEEPANFALCRMQEIIFSIFYWKK